MTSYGHQAAPHQASRHAHHGGYSSQAALSHGGAPAGTFSPGTKIQVGSHRVVIQKYLSEGGFAHVYLVKLPKPVDGTDLAVLKRVAVPDKETLRGMRTEVETMKRLKGHRPIVTYIDSHASELRGGGYEVFLLMEYCDGGGLIDFMNTRLQHRLTEPEILHIFSDIAEGVACMHYLKPALLHRDLKVENVLIVNRRSSKRFKLCDFGSSAPPRAAPTTVVECRLMDEDVQKHTTLQYRAPEMVDVYRKQPLNEKSDVWALGVLLYKLCYYTTPFEDQGQLAILNASFKYPSHPIFSDRLKKLIGSMLEENMQSRPNIYQVLKEACAMQGRQVPIHDIYSTQAKQDSRPPSQPSPIKPSQGQQAAVVGAVYSPPDREEQNIPDIVPMRRGRPTVSPGPPIQDSSRKVTAGDPFAALDATSGKKAPEADELSARFPTLDQFSLLHDKGAKFNFDSSAISAQSQQAPPDQQTAEDLADDAFASLQQSPGKLASSSRPPSVTPTTQRQSKQFPMPPVDRPPSNTPSGPVDTEQSKPSRASSTINSIPPAQTNTKYVSTGTMTSEYSSRAPTPQFEKSSEYSPPERTSSRANPDALSFNSRPHHLRQPSLSSRPSLEDHRIQAQSTDSRPRLSIPVSRPRPASTSFESSTLDFLRERELVAKNSKMAVHSSVQGLQPSAVAPQTVRVEGRKQSEESLLIDVANSPVKTRDEQTQFDRRSSVSTAPAPRKLAGKFNDAFNRFEGASPQESAGVNQSDPFEVPQTSAIRNDAIVTPRQEPGTDPSANALIDIDDDCMTPEMRRELERQKLEEEEKRVAAAQAEYRNRVDSSGKPVPGPKIVGSSQGKSSTIQTRVQNLLSEDRKQNPTQRTAHGYGKYTDDQSVAPSGQNSAPSSVRKPMTSKPTKAVPSSDTGSSTLPPSHSMPAQTQPRSTRQKPPAPKKKPIHLNSFPAGARPPSPTKQSQLAQSEHLIAVDLPSQPVLEMSTQDKEDYIRDFTKRFPSLGTMETESQGHRGSRSQQ
ncbi:serine/threonine protein kinase [Metarhizium album ARSEF 1941]|uniref:non-specific serine/threonine protein kinase n=1 Tax=Metarhizium album (strain ARSEF 1941) TaxID=1081103 RepID=A0A0B2X2W3_METAS|nr:serine/threonine protein kinase [Metarhizium album ARSEF 1941]KHO00659.1 serine/threonine protein kinase [Metarhizium album ARSEF 1941]